MAFPWIPRVAYDEVVRAKDALFDAKEEEIAWLRSQVKELQGHLRRMERVERELPELEPQPKPPPEEIPPGILRIVQLYDDQKVRADLVRSIREARNQTSPLTWEQIQNAIRAQVPAELFEEGG
jgi:hypothetical protein